MQYFQWGGLTGSTLGFGCGSVLGRVGRDDSLRAMSAAWDAGVNVFDVAPSYGFGEAEALLGSFLAGRRHDAVVITKFGIAPRRLARWLAPVKPAVRSVLKALPSARGAVQRAANARSAPGDFDAARLRRSVEESLRALRTDHVDVLLLHGPPEASLGDEALAHELEALVVKGMVRVIGVAGSGEVMVAAANRGVAALQTNVNPLDLDGLGIAADTSALFMANHVFGGSGGAERVRRVVAALGDTAPAALRNVAKVDQARMVAEVALGIVLRGTGVHVALPSMMNLDHLRANVSALTESCLSDEEVTTLRSVFVAAAELPSASATRADDLGAIEHGRQ